MESPERGNAWHEARVLVAGATRGAIEEGFILGIGEEVGGRATRAQAGAGSS
jgi:hypothetical protein